MKKRFWFYLCAIVCGIELFIALYFFIFGSRSLSLFVTYKQQGVALEQQKKAIAKEIEFIEYRIDNWNAYPLYREQWAREHLSVCYPDEDIYIDTSKHT